MEEQTVIRSCNRHSNCKKAEEKYLAENPGAKWVPANFHCHDDECPDCFGC